MLGQATIDARSDARPADDELQAVLCAAERCVRRFVRPGIGAEPADVVQEAAQRLLAKGRRITCEALTAFACNVVREWSKKARPSALSHELMAEILVDYREGGAAERQDLSRLVRRRVDDLPEPLRQLVQLTLNDMPRRVICEVLEIEPRTFDQLRQRAMSILRENLKRLQASDFEFLEPHVDQDPSNEFGQYTDQC